MLADIADTLCIEPSSDDPTAGINAVAQEARRPDLARELSLEAQRLAELLSQDSEHGRDLDPMIDVEVLSQRLNVALSDLETLVHELEELGWVRPHPSANSPIGIHSVSARPLLFLATDAVYHDWDPESDALTIAAAMEDVSRDGLHVEELAKRVPWAPRRLNPAVEWLVRDDCLRPLGAQNPGPFEYWIVRPTTRLGRLIRRSGD